MKDLFYAPLGRKAAWQAMGPTRLLRSLLKARGKAAVAAGHPAMVVFAHDEIGHWVNLAGLYEAPELNALLGWLHSTGLPLKQWQVLDIGANIGNHSLFFAQHFGQVTAFEANPRTFGVLQLNAALVKNITCHWLGLSNRTGTGSLNTPTHNIGGAALTEGTGRIPLAPLDSLQLKGPIQLIKIDVEGHESAVLEGATATLQANFPLILFEQHRPEFVAGTSPVIEQLKALGYSRFASLERSPQVPNHWLKKLGAERLMRLWQGDTMVLRELAEIPPNFYSFLVAIPPNFQA